jgi:hypothetical protein
LHAVVAIHAFFRRVALSSVVRCIFLDVHRLLFELFSMTKQSPSFTVPWPFIRHAPGLAGYVVQSAGLI